MSVVKEQKTRFTKIKPVNANNLRLCNRKTWPVWLTAEEASDLLRLNIGTVYSLIRQGELPAVKVGRTVRIDRDGMFYKARNVS
jgi:excisionase family DNA binding protein